MISAAHHTMMASEAAIKPPFDWSYETAVSIRTGLASTLPKFSSMPTVVRSITQPSTFTAPVLLWSKPGSLGFWFRDSTSSSTIKYRILDTETGTVSGDLYSFDMGNASNYNIRMNPTIDGKLLISSRYQGKVWRMNEDGTGFEYIGQTSTSFATNFGIYMYPNYDGTHTIFQGDKTNGPSWVVKTDMTISSGHAMSSTYPYIYIKVPDTVVVGGSTSVVSVFNEDMSTTYVSNRTVASYICMTDRIFMPPKRGEVTWGAHVRSTTIGIKTTSPYSNVTTSTSMVQSGANGSSCDCFLPNGQLFVKRPKEQAYCGLYDYNSDSYQSFSQSQFTTNNGFIRLLPTGKIIMADNGSLHILDYGIDSKHTPVNLCNGPFGYNGCCT